MPPSRPEFEVFFPPSGMFSYSYDPSPIWRVAPDRFAWKHAGQTTELNGSLTDFIEWLEIRRINQLLGSSDPKQRELGDRLREVSHDQHVATLLRICDSANGRFAQAGIREVALFVSSQPPEFQYVSPAGEIHRHRRWPTNDPGRQARDGLLRVVTSCPRPEHGTDPNGAGRTALQCLQSIGDRESADSLVEGIQHHQLDRFGDELFTTIEQLYGIPAIYERRGLCGNSSASEIERFVAQELKRRAPAIKDLITWQRVHADDTDEEFYDAVVSRWSETLIQIAQTPDRNAYGGDRTEAPRIAYLLGLGEAVISALQRRRVEVIDWRESAMLEFSIALLTGECDAALVTELLHGDVPRQRLACSIIAAAADPQWNDRVAELLRSRYPKQDAGETIALRDVAAQALYRSMNVDALPILQAALNDGFDTGITHQILDRFEVPVNPY
ncbi:MAG: hypothetical protein H8E66_23670 [Planctomycetes bacterium]|nr:hypothetical protein [Planctomycetota bacterium]